MAGIDYPCYSHNLDVIFEHAHPSSLAIVARTCRKWRQLSFARFHHIENVPVFKPIFPRVAVHHNRLGCVPFGRRGLGLLVWCKVLDMGDLLYAKQEPVTFLKTLNTVLYCAHLDPDKVTRGTEPLGAK